MLVCRLGLLPTFGYCRPNRTTCAVLSRGLKETASPRKSVSKARPGPSRRNDDDDDDDRPIKFSKTRAATWKAKWYREPEPDGRSPYTGTAVYLSTTILLIYFCILRDENDLDEMLYRPLTETIEGIDKVFPGVDVNQKPDYVVYHETNRLRKEQAAKEKAEAKEKAARERAAAKEKAAMEKAEAKKKAAMEKAANKSTVYN